MTANPGKPHTDEGQPGAALLRAADRLASAFDEYRHDLNNAPYTGTDKAHTVRAAVTASFRVTELTIEETLLPLGSEVVVERVTEALLNAQAAATQGRADRAGQLLGALGLNAELKEKFDSVVNDIQPNPGVKP